ncbi:hypothetical protein [Clostridium perfringens]|uniref:hypothetical protein n=1 Tax=Clostridium perfringens TaxID=1502 RepID=UPI0023F849D6|nr:hypothetical protein [Clostridium perfringens]WEV19284.1 hypothetical protein PL323_01280 [Clostridium perfringens D]
MRNKLAKGLFILGLVIVSTVLIGKLYKSSIEKKILEEFKEKFNYSEEEKKKDFRRNKKWRWNSFNRYRKNRCTYSYC